MKNYVLTNAEVAILRDLIGATLESFEASPMGHDTYYEKLALNTSCDRVVISNEYSAVEVGYESDAGEEEAGVMRIERLDGALTFDDIEEGPELRTVQVKSTILGIDVAIDEIKMIRDGLVTNSFDFTQAVVFHLSDGDFVVERGIWFEVFLKAYVTAQGKVQLRDTCSDWDLDEGDEAPYRGVVTRRYISIR